MTDACENCRYFLFPVPHEIAEVDNDKDRVGLCRRFPPVAVLMNGGGRIGSFQPSIFKDFWCGEFLRANFEKDATHG